ncbi:amidase signature enzyme [Gonapodya prolifera JEL478]|uniref:Amidase signature enzyme n=1 Tax=Gonapodya prolifera (strain JEL478) TaxID=1344416 RepID=A0A138ZYX3_GONPJ|nr:amidase signature enzyme [Gonapodya prolifera JEL478]|eukprot:KXS09712.1 amidase signature enzyme [Gonapodya prolifera JEL478]
MATFHPISVEQDVLKARADPDSVRLKAKSLVDAAASDPFLAYLPENGREERVMRETDETIARFRKLGAEEVPLFGIFVGVKDVIHVAGIETRANSNFADQEIRAPGDATEAPVVASLRAKGAIILGKVKTTEFAFYTPTDTKNPWNPAHTPGGSSSGSGAAVALGLAHLTLGTQTASSTVRPAAFTGVVAIKPTFDRLPKGGWCALAEGADTVGLFTKDVGGMRAVLEAVMPFWHSTFYSQTLASVRTPSPSTKPRLLLPTGGLMALLKHDGARDQFYNQVIPAVCKVFDVFEYELFAPGEVQKILAVHWDLIRTEMYMEHSHNHGTGLNLYPSHSARYSPAFLDSLCIGESTLATNPSAHRTARRSRLHYRSHISDALKRTGCVAILCPCAADGPAPVGLQSTGDANLGTVWTHPGVPSVVVPCGVVEKMPVAVQVVAGFGRDEEAIAVAEVVQECVKEIWDAGVKECTGGNV